MAGKVGRPSRFNAEVLEVICKGVKLGLSYERAAENAGVSRSVLHRWIAADNAGKAQYRGVCDALAKARAEGETRLLARVIKAGEEDWRAAAWILERRHPENYARMERREITGRDGGPVQMEISSWVDLVRQATRDGAPDAERDARLVPDSTPEPSLPRRGKPRAIKSKA